MFLSHGCQPEVECFLCWIVSTPHQRLENSDLFLYWWLVIMEVLAQEWVRRKMLNFWLLSVVEECLCLSSLMKFEGLGKRASILNLFKNCFAQKMKLCSKEMLSWCTTMGKSDKWPPSPPFQALFLT